jgi:membrane protease YdiL (CAAX protease family)
MSSKNGTQSEERGGSVLVRHPLAVLLVVGIAVVWVTQAASLLAGVDVMPAKIGELVLLLALATLITIRTGGAGAVRRLYAGLTRWRLGWWYAVVLAAMPVTTVLVGLATGTLRTSAGTWGSVLGTYLLFLALGALTGNLWEETVWGGFVQARLMAARGLLVGALLTSVPFFLIHLPLAFETDGWPGTSWHDAFVDWGLILLAAPFQRYLIGMLLVDTGGSTLGAGLLHASVNAAGAMALVPGGWQFVPALVVVTLVVAAVRVRRGLSATEGSTPDLLPAPARVLVPAP